MCEQSGFYPPAVMEMPFSSLLCPWVIIILWSTLWMIKLNRTMTRWKWSRSWWWVTRPAWSVNRVCQNVWVVCVCSAHGYTSSRRSGGCVKWTRVIYGNNLWAFLPSSELGLEIAVMIMVTVVSCEFNRSNAYWSPRLAEQTCFFLNVKRCCLTGIIREKLVRKQVGDDQ